MDSFALAIHVDSFGKIQILKIKFLVKQTNWGRGIIIHSIKLSKLAVVYYYKIHVFIKTAQTKVCWLLAIHQSSLLFIRLLTAADSIARSFDWSRGEEL